MERVISQLEDSDRKTSVLFTDQAAKRPTETKKDIATS